LSAKRAVVAGLVAVALLGVALGVASRRMRSGAPAPPPSGGPDAGALLAAGHADAGPDAGQPAAPDLVRAAAALAARLYGCSEAAHDWQRGRSVLARLELAPTGDLANGRLVDATSGAPAILSGTAGDCVAGVLAGGTDAGGERTTIWWPLAFVDPAQASRDDMVKSAGSFDLLVVPSAYPSSDLPDGAFAGFWLGLCGDAHHRPSWHPVTLDRTTDEDNDAFDDVSLEGCGDKPELVPVLRGGRLLDRPTFARVRPGARAALGEKTVRLGGHRLEIWQEKIGDERAVVGVTFGRDIQILLPGDTIGDLATDSDYALTWAGDLDGDGRLDLIVRDDDPDEGRYTLFASSAAPPGLPVGRAAEAQLPGD
jgi:hypothetical protein